MLAEALEADLLLLQQQQLFAKRSGLQMGIRQ
jgi:hypothetical protein